MSASGEKFDIHAHVTGAIVTALEAGPPPWRCPWREDGGATGLPLRATGEAYRGVNVLALWTAQARHWMTYRQARRSRRTGAPRRALGHGGEGGHLPAVRQGRGRRRRPGRRYRRGRDPAPCPGLPGVQRRPGRRAAGAVPRRGASAARPRDHSRPRGDGLVRGRRGCASRPATGGMRITTWPRTRS